MSWNSGPFMGFDLETTGLSRQRDRIVSAALVEWRSGQVRAKEWLADPGIKIPEEVSKIHGITTEYAQTHGQPLKEVVSQLHTMLSKTVEAGIPLVIFNASFDLPMIEAHFELFGLDTLKTQFGFIPVLDPLVLDRAVDTYRKGPRKLGNMAVTYGIEITETLHNAHADVNLTIEVLNAILAAYPQLGQLSLEEIFDYQTEEYRRWAENFKRYRERQGRPIGDLSLNWLA